MERNKKGVTDPSETQQAIETAFEVIRMKDLSDEDFKAAYINVVKE